MRKKTWPLLPERDSGITHGEADDWILSVWRLRESETRIFLVANQELNAVVGCH